MALNWEQRIDRWYAKAGDKEYAVRSTGNGFDLKVCAVGDNTWEHLGLYISANGAMGAAEGLAEVRESEG